MSFINKILLSIFFNLLKKNKKFKDVHKGESCYIFGNGSSLKWYDLKQFNDRVSIGCGALFAHTDIEEINLKYYYIAHPLFFYKYWRNPYSGKYEKNKIGKFYKRKIKKNFDIEYFASLSNYFGIQGKNINYVYHFGQANKLNIGNQMNGVFSMMTGSFPGMIGMALYMGFEEITLVGCDYASNPRKPSHFYDYGDEVGVYSDRVFYDEILNSVKELSKINTIVIDNKYKGVVIPSITYFDFTNRIPNYKENHELISQNDLLDLDSSNMPYKIYQYEN